MSRTLEIGSRGIAANQPTELRQQLLPLLQLLRAGLIGVAELLKQMDGFDGWALLGAGLEAVAF